MDTINSEEACGKTSIDNAIDEPFKQKLRRLLREYIGEVMQSDLSDASKGMYVGNAEYFVRWVHGDVRTGLYGTRSRRSKPFKG